MEQNKVIYNYIIEGFKEPVIYKDQIQSFNPICCAVQI